MATPYPPSPDDVPDDLTRPHGEYKAQAFIVLVALLLFALFWCLTLLGCLVLPVLALLWLPVAFSLPFSLAAWLLLFLLLKGFFRKSYPQKTFNVEVLPEEHPKLFDFIERLCDDCAAPRPHRVFLSPEVNAAVFYDHETVWSLFFPPPKNLLIGAGLVNVLNLSEFKAVLAHEFGHFSQKSMLLHRYVYSANRILGDLVFNRDWFDDMVLWMRDHPENGFANAVGWTIFGPLFLFRKVLEGYLWTINLLSAGLSRQMEFNADLVAVRVSGSDPIIQALARFDFAAAALSQAVDDLRAASDHGMFTDDLFLHQAAAAGFLRKKAKNPYLGEPPPLPADEDCSPEVFEPDDDQVPEMWATHPPSHEREANAKRCYLRCPMDERSAWLLFDDGPALREQLTWRYYRVVWGIQKDTDLRKAKAVQAFIDEEHAETTYDPRYHGAYDNRPIRPGKLEELERKSKASPWKPETLGQIARRLHGDELKDRMAEIQALRDELEALRAYDRGDRMLENDGSFKFRGKWLRERELERTIKKVEEEYDKQLDWLAEMDARVFRAHFQMAQELDAKLLEELRMRYEFHLTAQEILLDLMAQRPFLEMALALLSDSGGQMDYAEFAAVRSQLIDSYDIMLRCLNRADKLPLPKLKNLKQGEMLGWFLLGVKTVKPLRPTTTRITTAWISKFLGQIAAIEDRIRRIHFKSLGGLLAHQERVREEWLKASASMDRLAEEG
ncbi:MAG: M48 family metalloprotease [Gemmataceae bacterium]|nr:M48 family metalloprotease [Gemmataceae bacterium]